MEDIYDIVIIGGGPAGMTAGIYACRAKMKTVLIEKAACGGQILLTDRIENMPGFPSGICGPDLAELILKQVNELGLDIRCDEVKGIKLPKDEKGPFKIAFSSGKELLALSVILATGARWNALGVPGEAELTGKGVSYCATCDGPLFRDKEVIVVGGGDTALEDALFLTKFAKKVTIVHRRDALRATKILQDRAFKNEKIAFRLDATVSEILGTKVCEGVKIKDVKTGREDTLKASGVFVLIGITPNSDIVKGLVDLDEKGYVISDDGMKASADGIFVCGDVRKKPLRQVVTAVGEGAVAAVSARHHAEHIKGTEYPGGK